MKERHVDFDRHYWIEPAMNKGRRMVKVLDGPLDDGTFLIEFVYPTVYAKSLQLTVKASELHESDD